MASNSVFSRLTSLESKLIDQFGFRDVQHFFVRGVGDYSIYVGIGIQEGIYKLRCDLVEIVPVVVETSKTNLDGHFS